MPRPYSEKFLLGLHRSDSTRIGVQLAKACVKANLPAKYLADALGVTRITVYGWFRGKPLRDKNQQYVETIVEQLEADIESLKLPVKSNYEAKKYLEELSEKYPRN